MPKDEHQVKPLWTEVSAQLSETRAAACENFNQHCDDLLAMFEYVDKNDQILQELRSIRSLVNMKKREFEDQAAKLRAGG